MPLVDYRSSSDEDDEIQNKQTTLNPVGKQLVSSVVAPASEPTKAKRSLEPTPDIELEKGR